MTTPTDAPDEIVLAPPAGSAEELIAVVDRIEGLLASGLREDQVRRELGLTRRRGYRLITLIRQRWAREGAVRTRTERRDELRVLIRETYRRAMARTRGVPVGVGFGLSKLEHIADPDLGSAIKALELLARFDGLLEQPDTSSPELRAPLAHQLAEILGITIVVDATPGRAQAAQLPGTTVIDARSEPGDDV